MERRLKDVPLGAELRGDDAFDLDSLLHPAQAFEHPSNVVCDADLTLNEKRAILASWASDACAIEAAPGLRRAPGGKRAVSFDDVMEALRSLDKVARDQKSDSHRYRRMLRRRERAMDGPNVKGGRGEGTSIAKASALSPELHPRRSRGRLPAIELVGASEASRRSREEEEQCDLKDLISPRSWLRPG